MIIKHVWGLPQGMSVWSLNGVYISGEVGTVTVACMCMLVGILHWSIHKLYNVIQVIHYILLISHYNPPHCRKICLSQMDVSQEGCLGTCLLENSRWHTNNWTIQHSLVYLDNIHWWVEPHWEIFWFIHYWFKYHISL